MEPLSYYTDSLNILVVDDQDFVLQMIEAHLAADGHRATVVTNGADALAEFIANPWDVVLTDRAMPLMDGDQLAQEIKRISPQTPILMVTGCAPATKSLHVDAIVEKPFTGESLAQGISACLAASDRFPSAA